MIDLDKMELRELQREAARAVSAMEATNNNIYKYNKEAHHNSQLWYRAVITEYVRVHGDLPSRVGPGSTVKLVLDY